MAMDGEVDDTGLQAIRDLVRIPELSSLVNCNRQDVGSRIAAFEFSDRTGLMALDPHVRHAGEPNPRLSPSHRSVKGRHRTPCHRIDHSWTLNQGGVVAHPTAGRPVSGLHINWLPC